VTFKGGVEIESSTVQVWQLSDMRLKENIVDTKLGLKEILALRVADFRHKKGQHDAFGFVAQDNLNIVPGFVKQAPGFVRPDYIGVDEPPMMATVPTRLIPVLVRAIQEQQAEIEALKAKLGEGNE